MEPKNCCETPFANVHDAKIRQFYNTKKEKTLNHGRVFPISAKTRPSERSVFRKKHI
jgi:hypothetical protein